MIKELMAVMPKEAEQRTSKLETRKAYDTSGYGYQFCVNRFNEVCGDKWGFHYKILKEIQGKFNSGAPFYDLTVEVAIWVGDPINNRVCVGGHISILYADALKGAITNAFKKAAAFWGVGRQAYEGTMDDDNKPLPDTQETTKQAILEPKNEKPANTITDKSLAKEMCIFGKNNGIRWADMKPAQLAWYRDNFLKAEKISFTDALALATIQEILGTNINQPVQEDINLWTKDVAVVIMQYMQIVKNQ